MTKTGPVPIEVNLRMGGDEVYSFVKGAWRIDLIEHALKIAFGMYFDKIKRPEIPYQYLIGSYFLADNSGILVKFDLDESVKANQFLEELHIFKKIGDPVLVPPEGYEYMGWLVVSGINPLDAEDNLNDILKHVQYEVARFQATSSVGRTLRKNRFSAAVLNKNLLIKAAKIERVKRAAKENQKNLQIGLAGNASTGEESPEMTALLKTQAAIEATLKNLGYQTMLFDFNNPLEAMTALKNSAVDLVFNATSKLKNAYLFEPLAAAILEILETPFTGSDSYALALCTDKINVKKLLNYHNLPTPKWDCAYMLDDEISADLKYPLIVKPGNTNNSLGVTNDSVVTSKEQLSKQIEKIIKETNQPALVEEYIEGEEYHVAILGSDECDLRVLPLERMIFSALPENFWHIYSYDAKWGNDAVYQNIAVERPSKSANKKLETLITEIALDAYTTMNCHDYGIVDVRVDKDNNPYVLEVNPNPSLDPEGCLSSAAKLINFDYARLLSEIINMAIKRYAQKSLT